MCATNGALLLVNSMRQYTTMNYTLVHNDDIIDLYIGVIGVNKVRSLQKVIAVTQCRYTKLVCMNNFSISIFSHLKCIIIIIKTKLYDVNEYLISKTLMW